VAARNAISAFNNAVLALVKGHVLPVDLATRLTDGARQAMLGLSSWSHGS
jgi:hypothetical protein